MPVNKEIKGNLVRLLATEDLVVEHKNVATASFNVDTRVLILPQWDKAPMKSMTCWLVTKLVTHSTPRIKTFPNPFLTSL